MPSTLPKIEGETIGRTQPARPRRNWRSDHVSQTIDVHAERSIYQCSIRRTVTDIKGRVLKEGKRHPVTRFILSKGNKDKVAAWKQEFIRVLHVFNVRSIGSVAYCVLSNPLPDRVGNRYQHDGCGYPSKRVGGTGWYFRARPFGRCDSSSINSRTLTIA